MVSFYKNLSFNKKIYASTAAGFLIGMFFGDKCSIIEPINTMFIRFFQIAIIPYMSFSIVHSIGSLTTERAKRVGRKGGLVLIALWAVSILYAFGLQFSFPDIERSKFFRPESALQGSGIDFFDMFIPSNPFHSLANGYIPAIVIFCILLGVALINYSHKIGIVKSAKIWADLMNNVNNYIMLLLPTGVLVMATFTFGTLSLMKLKGVLLYVLASIFFLVFISMVIYPIILSSVAKFNYSKFFHLAMPAALIGFTTGSVFLSLPVIYSQMYKFNEEEKGFEGMSDSPHHYLERGKNAISLLVPLAWVVPASYKFLVIFYVVFANWYYDRVFSYTDQAMYFIGGIPCLFGSNSVVVPFLLQISGGIPNQAYDIFMILSSFLVYFNNANGAIFIVVATILCYFSLCNKIKIRWFKMIFLFVLSTLFFIVVVGGLSFIMTKLLAGNDEVKQELTHMNLQPYFRYYYREIDAVCLPIEKYHHIEPLSEDELLLDKIARTQTLQVGYNPEAVPFSFFNGEGKLVGYDIDFIYDIAEQLNCNRIEFYPVANSRVFQDYLGKGIYLDICVGGCSYRGLVAGRVITSEPYMNRTTAVVIPIELRKKYHDFMSVLNAKDISLGVGEETFKHRIENRPLVDLYNFSDFYVKRKSDAMLASAEIVSACSILYHGYWVYFYESPEVKLFYSFLLPYSDKTETFRDMVNAWISVCYRNGIQKARYEYWIMGEADVKVQEPWSILGWLQKNGYFIGKKRTQSTTIP